jgi:hypothetical protein
LDFTPIEPDETENKYYAPDVGVVLEVGFGDGEPIGERVELVDRDLNLRNLNHRLGAKAGWFPALEISLS